MYFMDNVSKEPLSHKNKVSSIAIIVIEILLLLVAGYFFALQEKTHGWENLEGVLFVLLATLLSVAGTIKGIVLLVRKKTSAVSLFLLIISICIILNMMTIFGDAQYFEKTPIESITIPIMRTLL